MCSRDASTNDGGGVKKGLSRGSGLVLVGMCGSRSGSRSSSGMGVSELL